MIPAEFMNPGQYQTPIHLDILDFWFEKNWTEIDK